MAPPDDVLALTSPEQFAALAHPLRQRLLFALSAGAATISRLAARLEVAKGSVAHHLKVLRDAGLVAVVETRTVRGGTEQYYGRTAKRLLIDAPAPEGTAALFTAVAQEVNRSPTNSCSPCAICGSPRPGRPNSRSSCGAWSTSVRRTKRRTRSRTGCW
ncbi:ArsR/SmtB family transcription factor [Streptacidiphilus monticola]